MVLYVYMCTKTTSLRLANALETSATILFISMWFRESSTLPTIGRESDKSDCNSLNTDGAGLVVLGFVRQRIFSVEVGLLWWDSHTIHDKVQAFFSQFQRFYWH